MTDFFEKVESGVLLTARLQKEFAVLFEAIGKDVRWLLQENKSRVLCDSILSEYFSEVPKEFIKRLKR